MSQIIANHRENAEIYTGDEICKTKSKELLAEINMPNGLLPLNDIVEVGRDKSTGFVWLIQKAKTEHTFKSIGKKVAYGTEITAFVNDRKMTKLTGVKSKEILIWVSISDIYIDDVNSGKITFGSVAGLSRTFPVKAFEEEEIVEVGQK